MSFDEARSGAARSTAYGHQTSCALRATEPAQAELALVLEGNPAILTDTNEPSIGTSHGAQAAESTVDAGESAGLAKPEHEASIAHGSEWGTLGTNTRTASLLLANHALLL